MGDDLMVVTTVPPLGTVVHQLYPIIIVSQIRSYLHSFGFPLHSLSDFSQVRAIAGSIQGLLIN